MNALKVGYKAADILEFLLDSQYKGFGIEIEQGYDNKEGALTNVSGMDF